MAVAMASPKRPAVRLVVVDDGSGSVVVEKVEEITSADVDTVEQLFQAARAIESRITGLNVERVVVRQADAMYASRAAGPRLRLIVEGAVAFAARAAVTETRLGAGKDLGHWCGSSKAAVDRDGAALVAGAGEHAKYGEAAAAALAALAL
jgi:hypothetical protein